MTAKSLAAVAFTREGAALCRRLCAGLEQAGRPCQGYAASRFAGKGLLSLEQELSAWTGEQFACREGLVFVGACGIAVRAIAPYVRDKFSDPAVVAVDQKGRFAVPLLSGHLGGGNDLARLVAKICGGTAVISTATDLSGCFAVDSWAKEQGLLVLDRREAKEISARLLEGEPVGFVSRLHWEGPLPAGLTEDTACPWGICITHDLQERPFAHTLRLLPRDLVLGIGCRKEIEPAVLRQFVLGHLEESGLLPEAVQAVATLDRKAREPALLDLCRAFHWPLAAASAGQLLAVEGDFASSAFVQQVTGVDNVCERAAVWRSGGRLILRRQAGSGCTLAVAATPKTLRFGGDATKKEEAEG